ncbi:DUF3277 family protein, partial [Klebsiella pneumoniae]|nr:DUF3277 family protein [Klebsiella pneumoniae]
MIRCTSTAATGKETIISRCTDVRKTTITAVRRSTHTMTVGADGEVMHSLHAGKSGMLWSS